MSDNYQNLLSKQICRFMISNNFNHNDLFVYFMMIKAKNLRFYIPKCVYRRFIVRAIYSLSVELLNLCLELSSHFMMDDVIHDCLFFIISFMTDDETDDEVKNEIFDTLLSRLHHSYIDKEASEGTLLGYAYSVANEPAIDKLIDAGAQVAKVSIDCIIDADNIPNGRIDQWIRNCIYYIRLEITNLNYDDEEVVSMARRLELL